VERRTERNTARGQVKKKVQTGDRARTAVATVVKNTKLGGRLNIGTRRGTGIWSFAKAAWRFPKKETGKNKELGFSQK